MIRLLNRLGLYVAASLVGVSLLLLIISAFGWEAIRLREEAAVGAVLAIVPLLIYIATFRDKPAARPIPPASPDAP